MKEAWQISKKRIERSAKMKVIVQTLCRLTVRMLMFCCHQLSKPGGYDKAKSCVAMQELRLLELKGKHDAESKMERRRVEEKQQHCQTRLADLESTWQRRKKQVRASARSAAPKPPFLVDMENKISLMVRKLEGLTRKCRQEPTTRCRERMSGLSERIAGVESKIGGATKFWRKQAELARLRKRLATKERQLREVHARVARYLTGRATAQLQTKDPVALSLSISKLTSKITNGRDRQRNLLKDIEHIQTLIKQVEDELETARLDFRPVKPNVPTRVFKKLANAANKLKAEVDSLVDRRDPDSRARLVKLRRRLRRIARRLMRAKARWQAKKAHYLRRRSQELVLGCIRKFHRVEVDIQSKTTKLGIFLFRKGRESTDTRAGLREDIRVLQAKARQLRPQCKSFAKEQEHQSQNHLRSTNEELSDKKRDIAVAGGRLTAARSDSTPAGKVLRRSLRTKLIDLNDEKTRLQQLVDKIMEQNQVDRKAYAVRERAAMKAASDAGDALEALREAEAKRATLRDLKEQQTDLALLTKKKRELEKRELHDKQQEESRAAAKKSSDLQEALKMARERKNELLHEAHDLRRKREHDERQRDERREMEREAKELLQKQTLAALKDASTSLHHRPGHVALPWGKKNCCARYNSDHPDKCRSFPDKRRPDARARRNRFDTCFGAIGRKCKGSPEAPAKAISFNKFSVFVSVGSILHDNCCLKYPHGYMCAHGVTDKDSDFATPWDDECACVAEYLKSSDNLRAKRFWNATLHRRGDLRPSRDVRTAYVRDSGGKWNRARGNGETISSRWVMAPAGTMLDCPDCTTGQYEGLVAGDSQFCASGKFSKVGVVEGHPEATHYGVCGTGAKIVPDIRRPNPELNQGKTVDRALVEKKARRLQKFFRRLQKQLRECRDRGQEDSDSCQELRRLYRKVKAKLKRLARQLSKGLSRPQRRRLRWKLRDARDKLQRLRVKAKKCADDNLEDTEHCKKIVQAVARLKELIRKLRRSIRKGKRVLAKVCELEADERNSLRGKIKSEKDSLEDAEEQLEECRSTHPDNEREGCLSERRSALTLRRHTRHMRRELHRAVRNCKLTVQEQEQLRDKLAVAKKDSTKVGQSIEEECAKFDDETGPQCRKLFRRRKELRRRIRFLERVLNKEEKEKPPKPQSKSYRAMRRHQKKELKALQERMVKVSVVYKECKARGDDSEACSKATHEYDHLRRATKGLRKKLNRTFKHVALSFSKRRALRRKLRKMQAEHARLSQKVRDCAGQDSDECSHSQFLLRNLKHKLDRIRVRLNYEGPVCSLAKIDGLKAKRNRLRRRVRRARRRARECDGNSDCVRKYYSKVDRLTDRLTHVQSRLELCRPNYRPSVDHLKRSMERIRKQIRDSQQALSTAKDDYTRSRIQAYLKRLSRTLRTLKLQLKAAKLRRRMESLLQRLQSVPEDSEEYKKLIKSLRSVRAQAKKADLEKEAAKAGEKVHRNHSQMKLQVMRRIEELEQKVKKHPNEPRYERQLQKSRETLASVVQGLPAALKRARFQATLKTQLRWLRRSINSVTRKLNSLDKSSKKFDRALRRRFAKPYSQYLDLKVKYASILIRSLRHQARRLGKLRIREQRTKTKLEEMRERLNSSSTEEDKSKFSRWLDDLKRMKSRVKRQLVQDSQRFYSTAKVTSSRLVKMMGRHQDDASNLNRWREHNDNEPAQDRLQELINDTKEAKSQVNSALEKATKFVKKGERSVQENPTRAVEENHQRSNSTTS